MITKLKDLALTIGLMLIFLGAAWIILQAGLYLFGQVETGYSIYVQGEEWER